MGGSARILEPAVSPGGAKTRRRSGQGKSEAAEDLDWGFQPYIAAPYKKRTVRGETNRFDSALKSHPTGKLVALATAPLRYYNTSQVLQQLLGNARGQPRQ